MPTYWQLPAATQESQDLQAEASEPPTPSRVCLALLARESSSRLSAVLLLPALLSSPASSPPVPLGSPPSVPLQLNLWKEHDLKGHRQRRTTRKDSNVGKGMHKGADSGDGWGLLVSGSQSLGKVLEAYRRELSASALLSCPLPRPTSLLVRHLPPGPP